MPNDMTCRAAAAAQRYVYLATVAAAISFGTNLLAVSQPYPSANWPEQHFFLREACYMYFGWSLVVQTSTQ